MQIKPSTVLRNDYGKISALAHETREPIYITKNGEGDLVVMSIDAFEEREKMLERRAQILSSVAAVKAGAKTHTTEEVKAHLKEKYFNG